MRELVGIILVFVCLGLHSQSIEGLWYNEKSDYFIQLDGKLCTFTYKWYKKGDTIGYFRNDHFNVFRRKKEVLKFKNTFYGQIVVGQKDRCRYRIVEMTESIFVLEPYPHNQKYQSGVLEYSNNGEQIVLRRENAEFYFLQTGLELKKDTSIVDKL